MAYLAGGLTGHAREGRQGCSRSKAMLNIPVDRRHRELGIKSDIPLRITLANPGDREA
jgi:hypothetical protein